MSVEFVRRAGSVWPVWLGDFIAIGRLGFGGMEFKEFALGKRVGFWNKGGSKGFRPSELGAGRP